MKSTRWIVTYMIAASVGLWFALFLSLKFVAPAHSQENPAASPKAPAPSTGDLPPEFLKETQNGAAPAVPAGSIPPPPSEPPPGMGAAPAVPAQQEAPHNPGQPPAQGTAVQVPVQGSAMPDLIPPMESTAVPIIPQFADDDQYQYDPTGRRDPFKPYKKYVPPPSGALKNVDLSDPLQKFDVSQYAIVAIMWEVRNPRAMVRDPDGKLYMVNKATKMGRNGGQIVAIREGEVLVVETIENEGVSTKEVKILELKK